jgi:16S rRNA G966 N2-methylase RsmD
MSKQLRFIDLFSGAGGLSVGFEWLSDYNYKSFGRMILISMPQIHTIRILMVSVLLVIL